MSYDDVGEILARFQDSYEIGIVFKGGAEPIGLNVGQLTVILARSEELYRRDKDNRELRKLVDVLIANDPNEQIADNGMTVYDAFKDEATKILREK